MSAKPAMALPAAANRPRPTTFSSAPTNTIGKAAEVGILLFDAWREQSLVDADVLDAGLHHPLIALVGDLLVVQPPRIAADVLVGVVADGVALAGLRLQREARVELVEPTRLARREDHVREHPPRAGLVVDLLARVGHLLVGQEPVLLDV